MRSICLRVALDDDEDDDVVLLLLASGWELLLEIMPAPASEVRRLLAWVLVDTLAAAAATTGSDVDVDTDGLDDATNWDLVLEEDDDDVFVFFVFPFSALCSSCSSFCFLARSLPDCRRGLCIRCAASSSSAIVILAALDVACCDTPTLPRAAATVDWRVLERFTTAAAPFPLVFLSLLGSPSKRFEISPCGLLMRLTR